MKLNNNDDSHNSGLNLLIYNMLLDIESHPAWVCGLKPRTCVERKPIPFASTKLRNQLGRCTNLDRTCTQQRMGEPRLLFCYEVQSSRHRYPVSAHGRN